MPPSNMHVPSARLASEDGACAEANERRGIQSIDVGLVILKTLADADSALSLTAVSKASGVPSSSCHRYLASFIRANFARQDAASGRYELGPGIIQIGLAALRRADPVVVGLRTCDQLAQMTQRTAQLSIWSENGPVIVSWRTGHVPVPTNLSVGSCLPLLNSATGRVFLSRLPRAFWETLVLKEGGSIDEAERLGEETRAAGFAAVNGDVIPGLSAAAAPLLDARGTPAAVITLLGLERQLTRHDIDALATAAVLASAELGSAPNHII